MQQQKHNVRVACVNARICATPQKANSQSERTAQNTPPQAVRFMVDPEKSARAYRCSAAIIELNDHVNNEASMGRAVTPLNPTCRDVWDLGREGQGGETPAIGNTP